MSGFEVKHELQFGWGSVHTPLFPGSEPCSKVRNLVAQPGPEPGPGSEPGPLSDCSVTAEKGLHRPLLQLNKVS